VPELTSKRVLTMEYMDGVGVNDTQGLMDMGADMSEVGLGSASEGARTNV
jgi:predicted unusual protein kinase regulating ubiquinone biosynthesis (AarF/ABC1/UbiB family)